MSKLSKEMKANRKRVEDLQETDVWANDATRKDIENIVRRNKGKIFGLHVWSFNKIRGENLIGAKNFSVSYLFKNKDEHKVDQIIAAYEKATKKKTGVWNREATVKILEELEKLTLLDCIWV